MRLPAHVDYLEATLLIFFKDPNVTKSPHSASSYSKLLIAKYL
jgi:hypothetical protein